MVWSTKEKDNNKKINPKGMKAGSAFHNFVNYPEYQGKVYRME